MPGFVPPASKVVKAKLALKKVKGTPGRKPTIPNKKGPKPKKPSTFSKQVSSEGGNKNTPREKENVATSETTHSNSNLGPKTELIHSRANGHQQVQGGAKTTDSAIYDFQSDAESQKAYKVPRPPERDVVLKNYWCPPPDLKPVLDAVLITDVTADNNTITVRECSVGPAFFKKREDNG